MPVTCSFDGRLAELVVAGRPPLEDIITGFQNMFRDPRFPDEALVLIDVAASDTLPPSDGMQRVADFISAQEKARSARIAILVADQVRYGLARQLGSRLDGRGILAQPFRERTAALTWLDSEQE